MPTGDVTHLRLFCICGQKMKVSDAMYGKPGKCISCKQKIRVPRPDELPDDRTDVYLKDFPKFLRKTARAGHSEEAEETPGQRSFRIEQRWEEEVPLGTGEEKVETVPLDVLEVLRTVCSVEYRTRRRLRALGKSRERRSQRRKLEKRLDQVVEVRGALDEEIRQRLMEVAIELTTTQEKISETGLAVRVGELEFRPFLDQVTRLRRRRELLEWRQQNLRGWLAVRHPREAGGLVVAHMSDLPHETGIRVTFPSEPQESISMLDWHVEGLRQALRDRREADVSIAAAENVDGASDEDQRQRYILNADGTMARKRADAAVQFRRLRLDQLRADFANDMQAVDAQLSRERGRLQVQEIDSTQFEAIESELRGAKDELNRSSETLARALSANRSEDMPSHGATQRGRARGTVTVATDLDAWFAWGASLFILACLFLPTVGGMYPVASLLEGNGLLGLALALLAAALTVAISGMLPTPLMRGVCYCGLWLALVIGGALYLHHLQFADHAVGEAIRSGASWWAQPGILIFLLGLAIYAAAAHTALSVRSEHGLVAPVTGVVGLIIAICILTDLAGALAPRPSLVVDPSQPAVNEPGYYTTTVIVTNKGRSAMWFDPAGKKPRSYSYFLERQIGSDVWSNVNVPDSISVADAVLAPASDPSRPFVLAPRTSARFDYVLAPGTYRVELAAQANSEMLTTVFSLDEFPAHLLPAAAPPQPEPAEQDAASDQEAEDVTSLWRRADLVLELKAAMVAGTAKPRFRIVVHQANGFPLERTVSIGDVVVDDWTIESYNRAESTATITDGTRLMVLRRGEPVELPAN